MRMLDCDAGRVCSVILSASVKDRPNHLTSRERCRAAASAAPLGETGEVMSLASFSSCLSSAVSVPSRASRIMLTVDSSERRRLEGLDMVVPRLLVLEWPRRCCACNGRAGRSWRCWAARRGDVLECRRRHARTVGRRCGPASSASMSRVADARSQCRPCGHRRSWRWRP